jgi:hypothetical protein
MADDIITVDISSDIINANTDFAPVVVELDLNSVLANPVTFYNHSQVSASATWTINHNLGHIPLVQAFNSGSQEILGSVLHLSTNQCVIYFATPISGFARLI